MAVVSAAGPSADLLQQQRHYRGALSRSTNALASGRARQVHTIGRAFCSARLKLTVFDKQMSRSLPSRILQHECCSISTSRMLKTRLADLSMSCLRSHTAGGCSASFPNLNNGQHCITAVVQPQLTWPVLDLIKPSLAGRASCRPYARCLLTYVRESLAVSWQSTLQLHMQLPLVNILSATWGPKPDLTLTSEIGWSMHHRVEHQCSCVSSHQQWALNDKFEAWHGHATASMLALSRSTSDMSSAVCCAAKQAGMLSQTAESFGHGQRQEGPPFWQQSNLLWLKGFSVALEHACVAVCAHACTTASCIPMP